MARRQHTAQPLFVLGDVDGFFGLAIDNLIQFLLIFGLCTGVLGFPIDLLLRTVLPAAALSIVVGNFLLRAARRSSSRRATGRHDVTALPYGINTVSLFAFVFLVMLPVKLARDQRRRERGGRGAIRVARRPRRVLSVRR